MKHNSILFAVSVFVAFGAASATAGNAPSFFGVVDSDGTLARGLRAISATHLATGQYEVAFGKDVTACGYTAAIGLSGTSGSSAFGTVNVSKRGGNKRAIFVQTFDTTNALSDLGFHVIVAC